MIRYEIPGLAGDGLESLLQEESGVLLGIELELDVL